MFKSSCTNHYRRGLIEVIGALEFRSASTVHRPVLDALELIRRYKAEHTNNTQYYARGERVPVDGVVPADLAELLYRADKRGRARVRGVPDPAGEAAVQGDLGGRRREMA